MTRFFTLPLSLAIGAALLMTGQSTAVAQQQDKDARQRAREQAELRYDNCLALIDRSPDKAINEALAWQTDKPGNVLARHCEAVALARDGEPGEGAGRLQILAQDLERGRGVPRDGNGDPLINPLFVADVWAQAANAWLLDGSVARAEEAIDRALSLVDSSTPQAAPFLIDRAYIAAQVGDYGLAYTDITNVLKADPARRDVLILLASAARHLGYLDEAETHISLYLLAYKTDPTGYLELGNLRDQQNRRREAKEAWLKVLQLTDEGPSAEAAAANLRRLALESSNSPRDEQPES